MRTELLSDVSSFDVVVTTYEMAASQNMKTVLTHRIQWRYLVLDEGHRIKNERTALYDRLRSVKAQRKLLLTGTPLQNNLHELWALLHFLYEDEFPTSTAFDSAFNLNGKVGSVDNERLAAASRLLQPLMLRRTKGEVEKKLPPKLETTIHCPLSEMQLFWYKRLLLRESAPPRGRSGRTPAADPNPRPRGPPRRRCCATSSRSTRSTPPARAPTGRSSPAY